MNSLTQIHGRQTKTGELWKRYYKKRRFYVLGTGWVKWNYEEAPLGFEGIKSHSAIREDFKTEIAWCRDMRTGYCFNQDFVSARFFDEIEKGADVKVPWELGRMYHWPQLALLAVWDREERAAILQEFILEIEDFGKLPVGKSVQYSCAMEVAIRSINLLLAFDIFTQIDKDNLLGREFKNKFLSLMARQREVILNRLEVNLENRKNGNHYLADLCGLLFLCFYMQGKGTKQCFEFACKEFIREIDKQFLEDGSNIECSTAYHRLASEISILGVMVIQKAGREVPETVQKKLSGMRDFLCMIKRPDGRMIQIGDNDSGRVVRMNLQGKDISVSKLAQYNVNWKEYPDKEELFFLPEELSVDPVLAMFHVFFGIWEPEDPVAFAFWQAFIGKTNYNAVSNTFHLEDEKAQKDAGLWENDEINRLVSAEELQHKKETIVRFPEIYKLDRKKVFLSECFGLVVVKAPDFFMAVRTVPDYKKMRMGHVHNDLLHYELFLGREEWFGDQGSYVYTGHKEWREKFRSAEFHNVPIYSDPWIKVNSMFGSTANVSGECFVCKNKIVVTARYADVIHVRCFYFYGDKLIIRDYSNQEFMLSKKINAVIRSSGYGMRTEALKDERNGYFRYNAEQ